MREIKRLLEEANVIRGNKQDVSQLLDQGEVIRIYIGADAYDLHKDFVVKVDSEGNTSPIYSQVDTTIRERAEQFDADVILLTKRYLEDLRKMAWDFALESSKELTEVQQWARRVVGENEHI